MTDQPTGPQGQRELAVCPFCGGPAMHDEIANLYGCTPCDVWQDDAEDWNRRAPTQEERLPDFDGRGWKQTPGQGADSISTQGEDDEQPTELIGPPWPTIHHHADGGYVWTWCPECGPDVNVDEDGGCVTCGYASVYYGDGPGALTLRCGKCGTPFPEDEYGYYCRVCVPDRLNAVVDLANWNAVTEYARKHGYVLVPAGNVTTGTSTQEPVVPDGMVLVSREEWEKVLFNFLISYNSGGCCGPSVSTQEVEAIATQLVDDILGTKGGET